MRPAKISRCGTSYPPGKKEKFRIHRSSRSTRIRIDFAGATYGRPLHENITLQKGGHHRDGGDGRRRRRRDHRDRTDQGYKDPSGSRSEVSSTSGRHRVGARPRAPFPFRGNFSHRFVPRSGSAFVPRSVPPPRKIS